MNNNDFWYELIKKYYGMRLYSDTDLDVFVPGYITEEQKQEIISGKKTTA